MKTILIFSDFQGSPTFMVVEGDYSHLNEVYINESGDALTESLQDQLSNLIDGLEPSNEFPVNVFYEEYNENVESVKVITCGFIP